MLIIVAEVVSNGWLTRVSHWIMTSLFFLKHAARMRIPSPYKLSTCDLRAVGSYERNEKPRRSESLK